MINKEKYLQRLRAMEPCAVAAIVEKVLNEVGVECSEGKTEILYDGLVETSQVSFESSTVFTNCSINTGSKFYSYIGNNEVIANCINMGNVFSSTDFSMISYELAA